MANDDATMINTSYAYPSADDHDIQYKNYVKKEFNTYKIPERPDISKYDNIEKFRYETCVLKNSYFPHQSMLSNYINPDTPYRGLLLFHGLGSGKTGAGIAIAENFKSMVQKYNTKIYILVPRPLVEQNWKNEILNRTGETYLKYQDKSIYIDDIEKEKNKKNAMILVQQYYKFITYKKFYKRVLGERVYDKKEVIGDKVKTIYKKSSDGKFERDESINKIYNLNNTLIIVDEAHNLTDNSFGLALQEIIKKSTNLRVVLLTGTPMKNLADDVVSLLNYIRPIDQPILRDKIFDSNNNYQMTIKKDGLDYFKKMASGYVSYVKGGDPLIFAKQIEKGVKPKEFKFIKVIRCYMNDYQQSVYDETVKSVIDDSLDRRSQAVSNIAFAIFGQDKKTLIGAFGKDAITSIINQMKYDGNKLCQMIIEKIVKDKKYISEFNNFDSFLYTAPSGNTVTGNIFKPKYLKHFSIKFYKAFKKINRLVDGKKGSRTAFVYSNLVKVGIEIFEQILLQNGYLEYNENGLYNFTNDTRCYYCGRSFVEHNDITKQIKKKTNNDDYSDSSSEYVKENVSRPHTFHPATFLTITGKSSEDAPDTIPDATKSILDNVFSNIKNKEGKMIKLVLGSRVIGEGLSLSNVSEVHILDAHFNLGRVEQVIGRAIRSCSHYDLSGPNNVYPEVKVYKYVASDKSGKLTTEENLYLKSEHKHLLIQQIEQAMKEVAIDCPLNVHGNMFKELCPDDFNCFYKCANEKLNQEYYDNKRKIYNKVPKDKIDTSTYTHRLAQSEISYVKRKIASMYFRKFEYQLSDIISFVKTEYDKDNKDLYDDFYVYKALDELMPVSENDFLNFKDTIVDKFNRNGYIIYVGNEKKEIGYYIFQPLDLDKDVPMYYRTGYDKSFNIQLSLRNYLSKSKKYQDKYSMIANYDDIDTNDENSDEIKNTILYDFNTTVDYYKSRPEFTYVGVIDKELSRKKTKNIEELNDVFKIRDKMPQVTDKKRGTGIPSLKGSVCTTKDKPYIDKVAKLLNVTAKDDRLSLCQAVCDKLMHLEKYSKGKDKKTYMMIPANHPIYPFPYNLEDRCDYIMKLTANSKPISKTTKNGYVIEIHNKDINNDDLNVIKKYNGKLENNKYTITID